MPGPTLPGFSSFVEVAHLLNSSLDRQTVLRRLLEGLDKLLGASNWSVLLTDEATGDLVFVLVRSEVDRALIGQRLRPGEGVAGWVAQSGQTLLLTDVSSDPRFSPRMDEKTRFATRSILAVPLRTGEHVIGVVEVINALEERAFTAEDLEILEAFAEFAAVAVNNSRTHEALLEANRNDPLTGLRNSTYFLAAVGEAVREGERFALIFFDMDHFKPLVDRHGHMNGSAALAEVGRLMAAHLIEGEVGCRFGGDEFAVLLRRADPPRAEDRARTLSEVIAGHVFLAGEGISAKLGASFGVAVYPDDADSAAQLLNRADARMYEEKRRRHRARR